MGRTVVYSKQTTTTTAKQINNKEQLSVAGTEAKLHPSLVSVLEPGRCAGQLSNHPEQGSMK